MSSHRTNIVIMWNMMEHDSISQNYFNKFLGEKMFFEVDKILKCFHTCQHDKTWCIY